MTTIGNTRVLHSNRGQFGHTALLVGPIFAILVVAILYPMFALVVEGVWGEDANIASVVSIFTSREVISASLNTLYVSILTVVIGTVLGVSLAWFVARTNMPFKGLFDPLNMMPFYLSSVVGALSWQVIAAPKTGILNTFFTQFGIDTVFDVYSLNGIALVLGLFYTPYVYLFTLSSLRSMDPALEEAARMSGAGIMTTALKITLPLSAPSIFSAAILIFVTSAGIFGVPLVLGVPGRVNTLSTLIYRYINDYPANYTAAVALSIVLIVVTALLALVQARIQRRRSFTTITGKGYRPRDIDLGRWRWMGVVVNGVYLLMILFPFLALLMVSFQDTWTGTFDWARLTLANYHQVLFVDITARRGLVNSLVMSTIGATISVIFSLLIALVVRRTTLPGGSLLIGLSTLPVAIPGIVIGVGFLLAWVSTPFYGTIWIIMLAYMVNYLPTSVRNIDSQVQAVSKDLDECARMSGATWFQSMRQIILPLLAPGLVSTWLLLFVTFIREVSASMMLFTYGTETMSIALLRIMEYAPYGVSGAFSVLQTVLLLLSVFAIRWVSNKRFAKS